MNASYSTIVVGGGAAGFFAALSAKKAHPQSSIVILEKNNALLSKVRVSGGGRCNVTHACFDPKLLVKNYPRGHKELLGPFNQFQPKDTIEWFESKGVALKREDDGRMFPVTNRSETIIDCLTNEAKKLDISVLLKQTITKIKKEGLEFSLHLEKEILFTNNLILATGSSPKGYEWAKKLGHTIQEPVPSLFTFNVPESPLKELSGISFLKVTLKIRGSSFSQTGPLLITHFGFSGPAVLKLSAWSARCLHEKKYHFDLIISWIPEFSLEEISTLLFRFKTKHPEKTLLSLNPFQFPKKFWKILLFQKKLDEKKLNDFSQKELLELSYKLCNDIYRVEGKTTHKEEFVTCGGITLKEVDFKTMESKICQNLFFTGEILDIDGITGGFNFQNAWTTGFIAGKSTK